MVLLCLLLLVVSLLLAGSGGWSAVLVVSLAGRCPGLPGRSGPLLWRRLLPVSWRRLQLPAPSGLLVLLSVGWPSFVAGNGPALGAVPCRWLPRSGCCPLPLILAVPALIGGKSDRQREEKPPSGNQQNQRGAFASRNKTTSINGRPKRQRRRCSAQAYESKV